MVLPFPAPGYCGAQCARLCVFLRRKGLLPRRASHLGILPGCLSDDQEALYLFGPRPGTGVLLGFSAAHPAPRLTRTDGLPSEGTDGETESHPAFPGEVQAD